MCAVATCKTECTPVPEQRCDWQHTLIRQQARPQALLLSHCTILELRVAFPATAPLPAPTLHALHHHTVAIGSCLAASSQSC